MTKTFNPYKLFVGAFIPNWLIKRPELSFGAKCCYARLCQFAGENGECFPTQDALAAELGAGKRTVAKYLKELIDNKLIISTRKGLQQPNMYQFVWHEWIMNEPEKDAKPDMHGRANQKMHGRAHGRESVQENQEQRNHKNDSSYRTSRSAKKRRSRKRSGINKDKIKQKANERTPSKKNNKPTYETKPNLDIIEVWNKQPNLRSHKNNQSNVYKNALKKLEHLRQGTLYKLIKNEELKNGVFSNDLPVEWTKTKWKKLDIAKAIKNLNEWCKEGNFPHNKEWIRRLSLDEAIYNPRTSSSPLMSAFKNGVQPIFDPKSKLDTEREVAMYDKFEQFFGDSRDSTKKKIVELVKDLSGRREKYKGVWRSVVPEDYGFGANIDSSSSLLMVNHYLDFLKGGELNVNGFKPRANISPLTLKVGNFPWQKFEEAYKQVYNAHPITGPYN